MTTRPVAFITGASQGIGAETAKEFARRGHDVLLLARNKQNLDLVADVVTALGTEPLVFPCDLADLDHAEKSVNACASHFGRIDVLVNNDAHH